VHDGVPEPAVAAARLSRFAELMVPRPGAGAASRLLAALLGPLAWAISAETDVYY
jgi:dimethylaniline monooxygenase (N-oxide forming)